MRNYEGVRNPQTRELVLGAFFILLGLVIPFIFHTTGLLGTVFLPMHFPILIAGFYLKPSTSLIVGAVTPFLSSIMTGMPVFMPMAPIMVCELAAYGLVTSFLANRKSWNAYFVLVAAMIVGRIVAGLAVAVLVALFGVQLNPVLFVTGGIVTGLPGILLQLLLIPLFISRFKRGVEAND